MKTSETIAKLAEALAKAQGAMRPAAKDSINPHFKSKYADLASVWDAIRDPLSSNGLSVTQIPTITEANTVLVSRLMHASGEWIESTYPVEVSGPRNPQTLGAALTYARRYALSAIVGVAQDDDDGESASKPVQARPVYRPQEPAAHPRQPPASEPEPAAGDTMAAAVAAIGAATTAEERRAGYMMAFACAVTVADLDDVGAALRSLPEDERAALRGPFSGRRAELVRAAA